LRGRFITVEGVEGAGKSTQARHLAAALRDAGLPVLETREPGGTKGAEQLRALLLDPQAEWVPLAETLLHVAARADHAERLLRPALDAGTWVVCDRYADSTMAYQGYGQGADRGTIAALAAMVGLRPDLTLVLDVPPDVGLHRAAARPRAADRYERLGADFFARVHAGFRAIAAAEPERCVLIDATGEEAEVAARVLDVVRARLCAPP
jgi:dTMP kinase